MANIEINVAENGTTTLATAGKYCDRNIDVVVEVAGGGGVDIEPVVLSGNCDYACTGAIAGTYIDLYGNTISTQNVSSARYMFYKNTTEEIPFEINFSSQVLAPNYMFNKAENLKVAPKINNLRLNSMGYLFDGCYNLRTIPEDFASNWDWSSLHTNYYGDYTKLFQECYSLRSIPQSFLKELWSAGTTSSYVVNSMFYKCYALDEINGFNFNEEAEWKNNVFSSAFTQCYRLANLIFATNEDGTAKIAKWRNQTIDLSIGVGSGSSYIDFTSYNSGITLDKVVSDAEKYQALKNDSDWCSVYAEYSRYNHDSAVNTINSLPDTSAYLASAGGTNTIKFKGKNGLHTDGGAINTLTEEEIAVAAAKGWTVTLI